VVQIDCGNTLLAGVSLRALKEMNLQEGDRIYCLIKGSCFFVCQRDRSKSAFVTPSPTGEGWDGGDQ